MTRSIAIVDDDPALREGLKMAIDLSGKADDWRVIAVAPLSKPDEYLPWLAAESIYALIMDWRLFDHAVDGYGVGYNANEVITAIRAGHPDFPIFVCSSYPEDAEKMSHAIEYICTRKEFTKQPDKYMPRITRATARYHDTHQLILAEMSILAKRLARGEAEPGDEERLNALRGSVDYTIRMPTLHLLPELTEMEKRLLVMEAFLATLESKYGK